MGNESTMTTIIGLTVQVPSGISSNKDATIAIGNYTINAIPRG